jgi:hypothetical protein
MNRLVAAIFIYAILSYVFPQGCLAQNIKVNQNNFGLSADIKCYQIIYKPEEGPSQDIDAVGLNDPATHKGYVSYYELLREKIKQKLNNNCNGYYKPGDVSVLFTLRSNGSLAKFDIDRAASIKDEGLIDIVSLSLKQASPFPPFPKELSFPEISFSVTISFKEK